MLCFIHACNNFYYFKMRLPVLDKFCFCCSLEIGGYIIGWFNVITGLFYVLLTSILLTYFITDSDEKREEFFGMTNNRFSMGKLINLEVSFEFHSFLISAGIYFNLIAGIVFGIINVVAGALLILGIRSVRQDYYPVMLDHLKNSKFIFQRNYQKMILMIILMLISILWTLIEIIIKPFTISLFIGTIITVCVQFYFAFCVYSLSVKIKCNRVQVEYPVIYIA